MSDPMAQLAIFVKTYRPDRHLVRRMLASINAHNVDAIPVVAAVPDAELTHLREFFDSGELILVGDSVTGAPVVTEKINQFSTGYIHQQMVKLSVHRLGIADNYLVLDSDAYFIRDFRRSDFLDASGVGLSVLTEDKDQFADPGYARFADVRREKIDSIADRFLLPGSARATCHNNTVLQSFVLRKLETWREAEGLSLIDLMKISPLEFSWYNFFLRTHYPERLIQVDPFIRMIHTRSEYRALIRQGFSTTSLARSYVGICINSGWAGRNQTSLTRRLDSGSRFARGRVRLDQETYELERRIENFLNYWIRRRG